MAAWGRPGGLRAAGAAAGCRARLAATNDAQAAAALAVASAARGESETSGAGADAWDAAHHRRALAAATADEGSLAASEHDVRLLWLGSLAVALRMPEAMAIKLAAMTHGHGHGHGH